MKNLSLLLFLIILIYSVEIYPQNQFWEQYCFNDTIVTQLAIDRDENFYAVVGNYPAQNLFISNDGGLTWQVIYSIPGIEFNVLVDTTNEGYDKIYLRKNSAPDSLFYSTNAGISWNAQTLPSDLHGGNIKEMAYNSTGDLYIASYEKLYVTTDNGITWQLLVDGSQNGWDLTRIVVDLEDIIYTNNKGHLPPSAPWEVIFKSENNGLNWEVEISSTGFYSDFLTFRSLPSGELYVAVFRSMALKKSSSQEWIIYENLIGPISMIVNKFKYIYAAKNPSYTTHSKYSPDYGTNWFDLDDNYLDIYNLALDSDGYLFGSTNTGIYRSVESTFPIVNSEIFEFPETAVNDTSSLPLILFNPFNSQLVIDSISSEHNSFFHELSFPISLNTGDSIISTLNFSPEEFGIYNDTIFIYSNLKSHRLMASGNSPQPFLISDELISFGLINIGETMVDTLAITSESLNTLAIDSVYLNINSVFSVEDLTFPQFLEHGDTLNILIIFTPDTMGYFIDTLSIISNAVNNIHKVRLTGLGQNPNSVENNQKIITEFRLSQNYPNPFNPATTITYQIPERNYVTLKVYDVLGNEVATLVSEESATGGAGSYEVEFNAPGLPSGIYFYQIRAGEFIETKKMILLK